MMDGYGRYGGMMGPGARHGGTEHHLDCCQKEHCRHAGSNVLDAGWAANAVVKVRLDGHSSASDSSGVQVMVFPLTS